MRWRGRRQSRNLEDRRGQGGFGFPAGRRIRLPGGSRVRKGGGLGLGGLILVVIILLIFGINPLALFSGGGSGGPVFLPQAPQSSLPSAPASEDEAAQFVSVVLAETEDSWGEIFEALGGRYEEPRLVLFDGAVGSACGFAGSATGPFYCPLDRKVYLDLEFFRELANRFGASGDFAQAYVIAHEVGHHVQNLLGILDEAERVKGGLSPRDANALQVRIELQADCFAGVWAHDLERDGEILEPGDLSEALNAAAAVGDDRIQRRTQGTVVPDAFTHGSSEQRMRWFEIGLASGNPESCDTFAVDQL